MSPGTPRAGALRQVAAFAPMCAFAAAHWAQLVGDPPVWRVAAIVAIASGCGLVLALSTRLETAGPIGARPVRVLVVAVSAVAAVIAAGVPAELLAPPGWGELAAGIGRGFDGLLGVQWPYDGGDFWVRQTVLLALPLICLPAAAFALWPPASGPGGFEAAAARRGGALILLLSLFAVAATERPLPAEVERGALLLVSIAAWLFLPALGRQRLAATLVAAGAVLVAGAVSLPIASALEPERPWIEYGTLSLSGGPEPGRFDWNHSYGPLRWPRTGETMLEVRSRRPHFWKMQTLDRFDGATWRDSGRRRNVDREAELAPFRPLASDDVARLGFTVRGLRSSLVAGAGTPLAIEPPGSIVTFADGASERLGPTLGPGARYSVESYVPEPDEAALRAARGTPPDFADEYLAVELPSTEQSSAESVTFAGPDQPESADAAARASALASPYGDVLRLAERLGRGRPTTIDVVRSVEAHLRRGYAYEERPPSRKHPLSAFMLDDRAGHCQHFSGAMALMLRMNGIPARVATGFAPGQRSGRGPFRVRDLDAHSWVEVLFPGIGWVTFDPTPGSSPAARPQGGTAGGAERRERAERRQRREARERPQRRERREREERGLTVRGSVSFEGANPAMTLAIVALLAGAAGAAAWFLVVPRLRRRAREELSTAEQAAELRAALERLGWQVPPRMTLSELEDMLEREAGPAAARYARRLRQRRFAAQAQAAPRLDRRALRRALTEGSGPLVRARGLVALPPAALRRRSRAARAGGPTPA